MLKYYIGLFLIAGIVLFYIFLEDPCNQNFRADFSDKYPGYKVLHFGSGEGDPGNARCHVFYQKPDSDQIYEDVWLYQNSDSGWNFSKILETNKQDQVY